jgi:hypothetical protein
MIGERELAKGGWHSISTASALSKNRAMVVASNHRVSAHPLSS